MFDLNAIDQHFVKDQYRAGQKEAIEFTLTAFNNNKKVVILEAPTGSGKTAIAMTLADMVNKSYYLTITRQLQDQLTTEFEPRGLVSLKGRNAYPCTFYARHGLDLVKRGVWKPAELTAHLDKGPDCASGYCKTTRSTGRQGHKCDKCFTMQGPNGDGRPSGDLTNLPVGMHYSACPYYEQVFRAVNSRKVTMNFSAFLFQTQMTKRFDDPRDLMIIDESHQVEPQLMDFVSLTINDLLLKPYGFILPELDSALEYAVFFEDANLIEALARALEDAKSNNQHWLEDELGRTVKKYRMFMNHIRQPETEWIYEYETTASNSHKVVLKPVYVQKLAHPLLFHYSKLVVMMSATILDVDIICRSLGIDRANVAALRLKNRFPAEHRPIYLKPVAKLTGGRDAMPTWGPLLVEGVNKVVKNHPGQRGIIHTHNFAILDLLNNQCEPAVRSRFLLQKDFRNDKFAMLEAHANSTDSILVAPAMHEGIDLHGDLCYDSETDILTEFGWIEFPKLLDGVAVAAYDAITGLVSFEIPSAVTRGHSSQWVEFDTMTNNLVVTANHRMLWHNSQTGSLKETRADEAPRTNKFRFICAGGMLSNGLSLTDDQLRLAAAYQADGCWSGPTDTRMLFSFRRSRKIGRLREILGRLGYDFREQETKRGDIKILVDKQHFVPLKILGDWDHDKIWKFENLMKLSINQRRILLSELSHWDGTQSKSSYHDKWVYCSSLPENIDTIQAVAALSNLRSDYNGHRLTYRDTQQAIFVPEEHNYIVRTYPISMPCYCVTVNTGWVIVRRRGKVSISGNSRFQLICKIPYPSIFDNTQLARRVELDHRYYTWLTALKLVQSYGRSVRSETDYADTYIMDESIYKFMREAKSMLPEWFMEAIHDTKGE